MIEKVEAYRAKCDYCGDVFTNDIDWGIWEDVDSLEEELKDHDWMLSRDAPNEDVKTYCYGCAYEDDNGNIIKRPKDNG